MSDFTAEETLKVHHCYNCGIIFGIPSTYEKNRREDHRNFHCPNGHSLSFPKKTEESADELKTKLEELEEELLSLRNKNTGLLSQLDQKDAQVEILEKRFLAVSDETKNATQD